MVEQGVGKIIKKIITVFLIAAAITAAIYLLPWKKLETVTMVGNKDFLASVYNNEENYADIFSKLQAPEQASNAKAGIISHHFLAKELIADFYNQVGSKEISTVFLVSPDHFNTFFEEGIFAYTSYLSWKTPFGQLDADEKILDALLGENKIQKNDSAMGLEHGIYTEIPFVKKFFPNAKIVPIVTKTNAPSNVFASLGKRMGEDFGNSILIVSSDFSHDISASEAKEKDIKSIKILKDIQEGSPLENVTNDCKQCLATLKGFLGTENYSFSFLDNIDSFDISGENQHLVTSYVSAFYAPKDYAQILFAGDLMFDRGVRYYAQKNGGNNYIFDKIYQTLINNDTVVVNLEGPITNEKSVSSGTIPGSPNNYIFTFDPSVAETLANHNMGIVTLGNNHTLNFGKKGIESTKSYLSQSKISYFGAPDDARSVIKNIGGLEVAFVGYNQFVWKPELEEKETIEEIKNLKNQADIIIVFAHWGNEYELVENINQRDLAHKFIDAGADLIMGSHPHVIQPSKTYKDKKIYYSLGNFVFDQYFEEDVRRGLGVKVKINKKTKEMVFEEVNFYLASGGQTVGGDY